MAEDWSGITRVYTSPVSLAEEARGLLEWISRPREEFSHEAGAEPGVGWLSLRWYRIDLACHVRLATSEGRRPESVRRLSYNFDTEPAMVERFARQLIALADSLRGQAILTDA